MAARPSNQEHRVRLTVNGVPREIVHGDEPLLWVLRDELGLTGTHYGCGLGVCGCCTVLIDGEVARSCQVRADRVAGREIVTLEGLAGRDAEGEIEDLHPVQEAFLENPLQCGWCLPGHVLTAVALLERTPRPTAAEIDASATANLCRCGGYNSIRRAVARAAELSAQARAAELSAQARAAEPAGER
jgi:aerobic-type carbon monoxide dehydrogenase small subunit (CoxS/CutS family)